MKSRFSPRSSEPDRQIVAAAAAIDPDTIRNPRVADLVRALRRMTPDRIMHAERSELATYLDAAYQLRLAYIRDLIIEKRRIDILTKDILGYQVKPFHLALQQFQFKHRNNLQLVFRGAGKSITGTICKAIWYLCADRDLRLVIASKKYANAAKFLTDIRAHLVDNKRLIEIFGEFKDPNPKSALKWNEGEIFVCGRTGPQKEGSITCVGVDGSLAGGHFDVEFSDDIVDNKNSLTEGQRDKIEDWYYSIFDPTMEPPDEEVPYRGDRNRLGTRYHFDDLYGRWIAKNEEAIKNGREPPLAVQIIPALDEHGRSPWPEKWPPSELIKRRTMYGSIIFGCQYQCNTELMKGQIFSYDDCQQISPSKIGELVKAKELTYYMGVDLAISQESSADYFAIVVLGVDKLGRYYVVDFVNKRLSFVEQTREIERLWKKWDCTRVNVEGQAYQAAQLQMLRRKNPGMPLHKVTQKAGENKVARANRLSAIFEDKRMFFPSIGCELLIEQLVLCPAAPKDDLFDAMEMAYRASQIKRRKKRERLI